MAVYYLEFNFRPERITHNKSLRKAIQLVFDPVEFTNKIVALPGTRPGVSLVPVWLKGFDKKFRQEHRARRIAVNLASARKHLEAAKKELGVDKLPPIVLLTGDTPSASKQAEYLQDLLRNTLGLEVRIDKQIFKQRLAKMTSGEFDIVAAGWGPDYNDIMTFGDLFASWNLNNRGRYVNPQYDYWVEVAQNSIDPSVRMEAMAKVQEIVIEDVVILPQYESSSVYIQHPKLKGLIRRVVGSDPSYIFAEVLP